MPSPRQPEGFSRDKDMEKARGLKRPARGDLDATERSADRKPDEHIDFPANVEGEKQAQPDRGTLADSGQ